MEPFIFILDLDGTIIGDCSYQVMLYNIEELCKKNKMKSKNENILLNCYKPTSKLMRPFFKYFIGMIKKHYPDSLFFIYTASDKTWASKEISMIEKTHNIKFNRPIFSRDDCIIDSFGNYRKSVKKILPKIVRYNKKYDIKQEKILVIDNNETFIDYQSSFLLCPTYNYILFIDIWERMKKEYIKVMEIYNAIKKLIMTNKMCKHCTWDDDSILDGKKLEDKHRWLYKKHKKINSFNKKYKHDVYWKTLANAFIDRRISSFDTEVIEYLRKIK